MEADTRVARRGGCLVLTRGRTDQRLLAQLETLRRAKHAFGERPLTLATLFDPGQVSPLDTFALANMFGLTPTEAKVAAHMADSLTAAQIGQRLGTTEATVRTQIKQVVSNLGATRAVDVVRLLRQGQALWALPAPGRGRTPAA